MTTKTFWALKCELSDLVKIRTHSRFYASFGYEDHVKMNALSLEHVIYIWNQVNHTTDPPVHHPVPLSNMTALSPIDCRNKWKCFFARFVSYQENEVRKTDLFP